jgi:hypothetical protein
VPSYRGGGDDGQDGQNADRYADTGDPVTDGDAGDDRAQDDDDRRESGQHLTKCGPVGPFRTQPADGSAPLRAC